jgi:MoaA/NifB/PqqE/SkfB family radical SAM enzyme
MNRIAEWKGAILAGKEAGIETVAVAGRGEPLLDANLWELAQFVRGEGLQFVLFTNGTLVNKEIAKWLAGVCTTVITKLYALEPQAHDTLVGVRGAWKNAREGLMNLLDAGMRGPNLGIDVIIAKPNETELPTLLRFARMLGIVPYFERLAPIGRGAKLNGNFVIQEGRVDEIFATLRGIDEQEFGLTWGFAQGMPALAYAETDKRMAAFHLDVFGNVQPGLESGRIMGNVRLAPGGIVEILENGRKWGQYYVPLAREAGIDEIKIAVGG